MGFLQENLSALEEFLEELSLENFMEEIHV